MVEEYLNDRQCRSNRGRGEGEMYILCWSEQWTTLFWFQRLTCYETDNNLFSNINLGRKANVSRANEDSILRRQSLTLACLSTGMCAFLHLLYICCKQGNNWSLNNEQTNLILVYIKRYHVNVYVSIVMLCLIAV